MIFKCPCCHNIHEAKNNTIISICKECQVEMDKLKKEVQNGEREELH